jgi:uncharacterized delta-60 repeat protein
MSSQTKVAGVWRDVTVPYVKVAGAWKAAKSAFIKVGGQWKNWFLQGGLVDESFNTGLGFNSNTNAVAFADNGKFFVAGSFTSFNGVITNRLVKLNGDGTQDTSFSVGTGAFDGFDAEPLGLVVQPDQKVIAVGLFNVYGNPSYQSASKIIRLNANGTRDTSFSIGTGFVGTPISLALQPDGKIVICGTFSSYNGTPATRIIRLNSDGTVDTSFVTGTGFNNSVISLALQPDGKIVLSGDFTSYNGTPASAIIRLNSDGTVDTSFIIGTGFNSTAFLALQPDGKIVLSGNFTTYNGVAVGLGIIRLNANGTRDTSFITGTGFNAGTNRIPSVQSDGKALFPTGNATSYKGVAIGKLNRIDANGNLDVNFSVNFGTVTGDVNRVFQHPDGRLIVTGTMTSIGAISVPRIAKISAEITG